jgi:hypothetical protein
MFNFRYALSRKDGKTIFSIPPIYYIVTSAVMGGLLAALWLVMGSPDLVWIMFAVIAALIVLAKDVWTVEPGKSVVSHSYGLWLLSRRFEIPFDRIASVAFVDERYRPVTPQDDVDPDDENAVLRAGLARRYRKGWVSLSFQLTDAIEYTIMSFPLSHGKTAKEAARALAEAMEKPFFAIDSESESAT